MRTMKAAAIKQWGDADAFEIMQLPIPTVGKGDVLIQVAYAGVNPADWKIRQGHVEYFASSRFPLVIGFDAAGIVVAIGDGASHFSVGDRVFTSSNLTQGQQGSYAEYVVAHEQRVALVPEDMTFESAAAIPIAAETAWQALFAIRARRSAKRCRPQESR